MVRRLLTKLRSPGMGRRRAGLIGKIITSFRLGRHAMSYNVEGFRFRADECVRLANLSKDQMIQRELLSLRQVYLKAAERLSELPPPSLQEQTRPA